MEGKRGEEEKSNFQKHRVNSCLKIVTAAHCCDGLGIEEARITVGDYTVEDGDQDGTEQIFKISSMKIHENFDMDTIDYDVCVLTV